VAEDNRTNQLVTRSFLEQHGHTVTVVDDGVAALDILEVQSFDLAVVDMMMPGHGGLDVIKLYRHLTGNRTQMPFIVLTANVSEEARAACRALEVKYLSKPLRGQALQTAVQELLMQKSRSMSTAQGSEKMTETSDRLSDALIDEEIFQELAMLMGPGSRMAGLVDDFYRDAESLLSELKLAIERQEWVKVSDLAHGLKGAALGIGAQQLAQEARKLEGEIIQGTHWGPKDPFEQVEAAYHAVRTRLEARVNQSSDSSRFT
jgi:CheY-like chemotaxis protein/HPt (histidine-containing phosphotransfer) domain-containing protein